MCIRIIGARNRQYAHIGDIIIDVIKEEIPTTPLERSEVVRAVIVHTRKELKRDNGMITRYDDNAAIIIDQEGNPKGICIFGTLRIVSTNITDNIVKVLSWASADTRGFNGTKRGTPSIAQITVRHAIRTMVGQGMQRAEVMTQGPGLARDAALRAIYRSGQADTIGITMRRALLGEIEGTRITRAKIDKLPHEYPTIVGPGCITAQDIILPPYVEIVDNT
ncbi:50S ribosomal protein L14 chloroplastic [Bienertia sinuspersici]